MATRGKAGDAPASKRVPLPAGEGKDYAAGHHGTEGSISASQIQSAEPKIHSCGEPKIPSGNYVGVGPMLAAGGFAGVDAMVAARYFSSIYHQAVKPPVLLYVPRTVQFPVVLQSPREHRIVSLFQNYMRRVRVMGEEKLIALLDRREDRAEKKKLDDERLKFEKEKKQFEEEKLIFEQYKKQFPQIPVVMEAEKKQTMPALIANKIETAEKHITLFEKVINAPTKAEQLVKTIQENTQVVNKKLETMDSYQKVKNIVRTVGTGVVIFFKEEIKEYTGLRGGGSSEVSIGGGESNGTLNEGKSGGLVPKVENGAGDGATVTKVGSAQNALGNGGKNVGAGPGAGAPASGAVGVPAPGAGAPASGAVGVTAPEAGAPASGAVGVTAPGAADPASGAVGVTAPGAADSASAAVGAGGATEADSATGAGVTVARGPTGVGPKGE